jgi:hypothetical protein
MKNKINIHNIILQLFLYFLRQLSQTYIPVLPFMTGEFYIFNRYLLVTCCSKQEIIKQIEKLNMVIWQHRNIK